MDLHCIQTQEEPCEHNWAGNMGSGIWIPHIWESRKIPKWLSSKKQPLTAGTHIEQLNKGQETAIAWETKNQLLTLSQAEERGNREKDFWGLACSTLPERKQIREGKGPGSTEILTSLMWWEGKFATVVLNLLSNICNYFKYSFSENNFVY